MALAEEVPFRRVVALMTASSLVVPLVGLVSAPLLARALGVEGRGALAAALNPSVIIVVAASLGLPEALTFLLAKRPRATWRALLSTSLLTAVAGLIGVILSVVFADSLAGGDHEVAALIELASWLVLPGLFAGLVRGAATGRQMWLAVAGERIISSLLRLAAIVVLMALGLLTPVTVIVTSTIASVVALAPYWRLVVDRPGDGPADLEDPDGHPPLTRQLLGYGSRTWLGSMAGIIAARLSALLITPLASAAELGLFVVANTISDIPYLVTHAVRDSLFGVSSRVADAHRVATTSRVMTLAGLMGSLVVGLTLPFWIGPLFGDAFTAALPATWILLAAAVINIPGLVTGAGLAAWGRPGLRSLSLVVAVVTDLVGGLLLIPQWGAVGAAVSGLVATSAVSLFSVVAFVRVTSLSALEFAVPRGSDVVLLLRESKDLVARVRGAVRR
ncbi:oligosaccharide flippase family protein [Geodermatophilus sp. SYSU D00804]